MTLDNEEIAAAYEECVHGVVRQRGDGERDAAKRAKKALIPRVTERTAEKRKARLFAASGSDPRIAAAALHRRLNHERRQEKAADIEAAIDAVDALIRGEKDIPTPTKSVLDVFDRWCANCKSHRVDDPCEVCNRKTLVVKGD